LKWRRSVGKTVENRRFSWLLPPRHPLADASFSIGHGPGIQRESPKARGHCGSYRAGRERRSSHIPTSTQALSPTFTHSNVFLYHTGLYLFKFKFKFFLSSHSFCSFLLSFLPFRPFCFSFPSRVQELELCVLLRLQAWPPKSS
jgi:hypothetical protein